MSAPSIQKVLNVLEATSGDNGACLSVRELADKTGCSESSVRRALKTLKETRTITIGQCEGETRNGGTTNCYRMTPPLSVDDTPSVTFLVDPLPVIAVDPLPFDTPSVTMTPPLSSSTVEYVHEDAAGARGSVKELKEQKEFALNTKQTDSLMPENTRGQGVAPLLAAETEAQIQQTIQAASPEAKAAVERAMFEAKNRPASGVTNAPHPVPLDPLPVTVLDAYKARYDEPSHAEHGKLLELLKGRTPSEVAQLVERCDDKDRYGDPIGNPAGWLLKTTPAPGRQPATRQAAPRTIQPETEFMAFSGWGSPAPAKEAAPC